MTEQVAKPSKRFWLRLRGSDLFVESAPADVFDAWAESALTREVSVIPAPRFGNLPGGSAPMIRYERTCSGQVSTWTHALVSHAAVKRRRLAPDAVLPEQYQLSLFIAFQYVSVLEALPPLLLNWARFTRPATLVFDGSTVPGTICGKEAKATHRFLCGLAADVKHTACYGPVAVAVLYPESSNDQDAEAQREPAVRPVV